MVQVTNIVQGYPSTSFEKSTVKILALSLEDEASISGTAEILKKIGKEFGIETDGDSYIFYDDKTRTFLLEKRRERFRFYKCLKRHQAEVERLKEALKSDSSFEENETLAGIADDTAHGETTDKTNKETGEKAIHYIYTYVNI